ncbi:MAG: acetyl-CoA carboxylase biotin carboxyl carrier protein [Bacillota bacterium]
MNNKELKNLIKIFESSSLGRLKIERDDVMIELEKPRTEVVKENVVVKNPEPKQESMPLEEEAVSSGTSVKAPLVGTFYESPAPDQAPFVRVGQTVKEGQTLCIIEAMKVMNEITAPVSGTINKIHVNDSDMVMFDQVIMEIKQ